MSNDSDDKSLVKITDLFGVAKPLEQLVSAIERGIGNFMRPIQKLRETKADISSYNDWNDAIAKTGLSPKVAELTLGDRATIRITAESIRQQGNRESIAVEAVNEYLHSLDDKSQPLSQATRIESEWLDRFWRLAQDVTDSEMQAVWGRILARQAREPTKYSARCLETLSLLSRQEALKLEKLSKFVIGSSKQGEQFHFFLLNPYRVVSDHPGEEIAKRIQKAVGDPYRSIFGPSGLYTDSGSGWAQSILIDVENGIGTLSFAKSQFKIHYPNSSINIDHIGSGLEISPLGAEIFSLIETEPDPQYIADISNSLSHYGLRLERNNS